MSECTKISQFLFKIREKFHFLNDTVSPGKFANLSTDFEQTSHKSSSRDVEYASKISSQSIEQFANDGRIHED